MFFKGEEGIGDVSLGRGEGKVEKRKIEKGKQKRQKKIKVGSRNSPSRISKRDDGKRFASYVPRRISKKRGL